MPKRKIINDPLYGFINISGELIFDLIHHPAFQRLRRICQLGLTSFVYPGALHSRFHHALGAMHLMGLALDNLRQKGNEISEEEYQSAQIAILLHDIGHGPFSHTLERTILKEVHHEEISVLLMEMLNEEFSDELALAIKMFKNTYERPFFHQLVSSQLDVDRMDYLQRDSFFTGVHEGIIGVERLIKLLNLANDEIVVEEKGIYSVENFLNARRMMYWQVYLHKTTISAEQMLILIFKRAKHLFQTGVELPCSKGLRTFLENEVTLNHFLQQGEYLNEFLKIDDYDIWGAIKLWVDHEDHILKSLCLDLLDRNLFKVTLGSTKVEPYKVVELRKKVSLSMGISQKEAKYFVRSGKITNSAYISRNKQINILCKDGQIRNVAEASDLPNIKAISKIVKKYYLCVPKQLYL